MIEHDLFGTVRLVRNWGRIGTIGQEQVEVHADRDRGRDRRWRLLAQVKRRRRLPRPLTAATADRPGSRERSNAWAMEKTLPFAGQGLSVSLLAFGGNSEVRPVGHGSGGMSNPKRYSPDERHVFIPVILT